MKTWFINWWDAFRTSYWFVPALMGVGAVILALLMPELDRLIAGDVERWFGWIVTTAPAARFSLSSIASAMITVTGVVFSITIVAVANTATQFGSRLLRKMMDDVVTHFALGSLVATSLYSLLVLRVVRNEASDEFVPHLSVALGIVFAVVSMGIFIYFIHDVAVRLQAPNLVHSVAGELQYAINHLFPDKIGGDTEVNSSEEVNEQLDELGDSFTTVSAQKQGYLQAIDGNGLMELASARDLVIYIPNRPGAFVSQESALVQLWPKETKDDSLTEELRACFIVGNTRTPRQDVECAINELVEIAVRALSPGINDPFTAMTCLDYLGASFAKLASRKIPSPFRKNEDGRVRVFAQPVTFPVALHSAFRMILRYGRSNPAVVERMLHAIDHIVPHLVRQEDKDAVHEELQSIRAMSDEHLSDENERLSCSRRCEQIYQAISNNEPEG